MKRVDGNGSKKQPWSCCACRNTHEHRCYKCFCGKCPWYTKKVPPVSAVKDQAVKVSSMDTSAKQQPIETSDPCGGDEYPPGFSSIPSTLRSSTPTGIGERADVAEDGETSPHQQRGNDEAEKQKDGGSSKPRDGFASIWDVLAEKEQNASVNQVGWVTKPDSASSWGTKPWNERRYNDAAPVPSWSTGHDYEPRGTRSASRGNASRSPSRGTLQGNERRGSQYASGWDKRPVNKPRHSRDAHRVEEPRGTRHENERIDNATRSDSSRGTRPVNEKRRDPAGLVRNQDARRVEEPRGNKEVMCSKARDGLEPVSRISHVESSSRTWSSRSGKRSRGSRENWTHGIEDLSSTQTKKPRGPQEIVPNTTKDRSSEAVLLKPHVNSGSCQASESVKESRGTQDVRSDSTRDGSSKSISPDPPSGSYSRRDADIVKDARSNTDSISRNVEGTTMRAGDGSGQALHNHHAQPGSTGDASAVKAPRGNVEVTTDRAGYDSEELHNRRIHSGSGWEVLKIKGPSGNHEITTYKAENRCLTPALHNPNAGSVSTLPSLTAKETTGCSVSDKETDKDGQHDATIPSYKLEGVVRVDKIFHPSVASQRAKPSPVIISGESHSTKLKLCSSPEPSRVGPALPIIWKGKFEVPDFPGDKISEVFLAHSAANVSLKAYKFASRINYHLLLNIQPRRAFWPKIFQSKCPDNRDVALYFYPQRDPRPKKKYAKLLKLLEGHDLMLRSVMGRVELLVFSSKLLDSKFQTLEGSMYLWGVFHKIRSEKVVSSTDVLPTPHLEPARAITNSTSTSVKRTISPSLEKHI